METKPVITCLKTLLIIYSFVFWVSGHAWPAAGPPSIGQCSDAPGREGGGKNPKQKSNLGPLLQETGAGLGLQDGGVQAWGCSDPGPRPVQGVRGCVVAVTAGCRPFQNILMHWLIFLTLGLGSASGESCGFIRLFSTLDTPPHPPLAAHSRCLLELTCGRLGGGARAQGLIPDSQLFPTPRGCERQALGALSCLAGQGRPKASKRSDGGRAPLPRGDAQRGEGLT